jgi:uncharacterized membrane protein YidH (DUF202 family)
MNWEAEVRWHRMQREIDRRDPYRRIRRLQALAAVSIALNLALVIALLYCRC